MIQGASGVEMSSGAQNMMVLSHLQVQTIPTQAARNTRPTERLEQLAEAKKRPDGPFREPEWPVSKKAMKAQSTERTRELSRSKGLVEGFQVGYIIPLHPPPLWMHCNLRAFRQSLLNMYCNWCFSNR